MANRIAGHPPFPHSIRYSLFATPYSLLPIRYSLFATPYSLLAGVSRPAHHRRHEVLDRGCPDLLHHGVGFGAQKLKHPLDAGLAEGAETPDIGPADADRVGADT